jgi:hypothetical protein
LAALEAELRGQASAEPGSQPVPFEQEAQSMAAD